ncbi:MAG: aspartate carbamoyltransferase catalytic subunit [Deltaproteobacteria bacterium]|nr:aspartate carbamoyltransferase catalytic subunit [Deltaproteobacteria bacterium]
MKSWKNRSLIEARELSEPEIRAVLARAGELKKLWQGWRGSEFPHQSLRGKTVVNLFFEPSTRTRSSFELAADRLGAHVLNLSPEGSSISKGETLFDTAKNLEAMDPDLLVVRHASAGAPYQLSKIVRVPIINAGDGFHEHPSQALLDAFTIEEAKGGIKGLRILIVGDIAHSRVARSCIYTFRTLGAKVAVCGPPSLIPPSVESLGVTLDYHLHRAIRDADVVMMLRIQLERQARNTPGGTRANTQFPSLGEYSRFWGLNVETVKELKQGAIIMHPGPLNEGVEISQEVATGPYSVILNQVSNGVIVRMALMDLILGNGGRSA